MPEPLVSVIIAVKNGERFLETAINSVLSQNYRRVELIVIDDQSVDRTAAISRSFSEVSYVYHVKTNPGLAEIYNVGLDAATGEFIAFLSHDDLWTWNKLSTQTEYLLNHPEIQYAIARVKYFLEPGYPPPPDFRVSLLQGDHVGLMMETLVARKSVFETVGRFDPALPIVEDADWFVRANDMNVPSATIHKVLLYKRVHDANFSLNTPEDYGTMLRVLRQSIRRKRSHEIRPK